MRRGRAEERHRERADGGGWRPGRSLHPPPPSQGKAEGGRPRVFYREGARALIGCCGRALPLRLLGVVVRGPPPPQPPCQALLLPQPNVPQTASSRGGRGKPHPSAAGAAFPTPEHAQGASRAVPPASYTIPQLPGTDTQISVSSTPEACARGCSL